MPERSPWTFRQRFLKRSLDLAIAVPALVVTSPIIVLAVIAARIDTGQAGIFAQQRVGMHGRLVTVYKIRTMRSSGPSTVTARDDIRVTGLGRRLRKFKIDELPQLANVVLGDMSLVGPRPDVPGFADLLADDERLVLAVRPGITGPATLQFRHEEETLASAADPEAYNREVIYPAKVAINLDLRPRVLSAPGRPISRADGTTDLPPVAARQPRRPDHHGLEQEQLMHDIKHARPVGGHLGPRKLRAHHRRHRFVRVDHGRRGCSTSDVAEVRILSRDETKQDEMRRRLSDKRLRFFLGDVRDYDSVARRRRAAPTTSSTRRR